MILSGAVTGSKISLVSTSVGGQVATLTGTVAKTLSPELTQSSVAARTVIRATSRAWSPLIPNQWSGTCTGSGDEPIVSQPNWQRATASLAGQLWGHGNS